MFERFTERARKAVVEAQNEARLLQHNYIGTEHLLLGLIAEDEGIAARVLRAHGLFQERVRVGVEGIVGRGSESGEGQAPFTPRATKVLEFSLREALVLKHNYIGTEHMLLGLLKEKEGVAARVLRDCFGSWPEDGLRRSVLEVIEAEAKESKEEPSIPEADILAHRVALYALLTRERGSGASPCHNSPAYRVAWDRFYKPPCDWDAVLDEYQKEIRGT